MPSSFYVGSSRTFILHGPFSFLTCKRTCRLPNGKICTKRGTWEVNKHFILFSCGLSHVCFWVLKLAVVFLFRLGCACVHFIEWKWARFGMGPSRRPNLFIYNYWDRGLGPTQFIAKMKEPNFWKLRLPSHFEGLEIDRTRSHPWTKWASTQLARMALQTAPTRGCWYFSFCPVFSFFFFGFFET